MADSVSRPPGPDEPGAPADGDAPATEAASAAARTPRRPRARAPSSRKRSPKKKTAAAPSRAKGHGWWEWVEASGIELVGVGRLRFLLRRFGWKGILILVIVAGYPVGQYSLISYAVNSSLPVLAGDFGVRFEAEEWSYHPLALAAVARNVKILPPGHAGDQPLATAAEVEFKGSLWSSVRGLVELLSFRTFHTFNEIVIRHGQIVLERSPAGTLNWTEYAEAMPDDRRRELMSGLYRIHALVIENGSISYVEHLSGGSGGGVIQTTQARVYVDGINGAMTGIGPADDPASLPTRLRLDARSSDGTIHVEGRLGLRPEGERRPRPDLRQVSLDAGVASGPGYELIFVLNNIGAAAFVRSLPATSITATGGSVHGRLTVRHATPVCESDLRMENVTFAPNAQLVGGRTEYETLQRQLQGRSVSRAFVGCDGRSSPATPERPGPVPVWSPVSAVAASFNEQANADAPRNVRLAVARDSQSLTGRASTLIFDEMTRHLPPDVAAMIDAERDEAAGNAVSRGARSVGNRLRRLFGGGGGGSDDNSRSTPRTPNRPPGR